MLIRSDARLIPLRDKSVNCVVTSPPYWGLRDYGDPNQIGLERTPEEYVESIRAVFREVWRVLRGDGVAWLNLSDSYNGSGRKELQINSPKQMTSRGAQSQRGTSVAGLKPKDLCGIPWRVAFALQADGWYLRSDIIWAKPNPMPESVTDRPTRSHEYLFLLSKARLYWYDADAIREPNKRVWDASNGGSWSYGKGDAARVAERGAAGTHSGPYPLPNPLGANKCSVWTIATQGLTDAHFATFPEKLVEPCILAGCPRGGIVFDPFVGSGTTVRVAERLNRIGIGCDLKYQDIGQKRTRNIQKELLA